MFRTNRARPAKISNENCCYSDEDVREIDATPDSDLRWSSFKTIFTIAGCTATYEEQTYFLPLALEYLKRNPEDGSEYTSDLVYFLSMHAEDLQRDGLLDDA